MLAAAAQAKTITAEGKTLTQANFISLKNPARQRAQEAIDARDKDEAELDPEFLAALPEDMRKEVTAEHKAAKLRAFRLALQRPRPGTSKAATHVPNLPGQVQDRRERVIKVQPPPKATFTKQKISREKDLRSAMRDWVHEFEDEGPYPEDVDALSAYLGRLVTEEGDMRKAVGVVKWLDYIVGDLESDGRVRVTWEDAVERVKAGVSRAARQKGLGLVNFD
jgi:DNA repair protein REV1